IQVIEEELNAWTGTLAGAAAPPPPKPGAKPPAADKKEGPAPEGILIPGRPNFRLAKGKVQVGLNCTLHWDGMMKDVTVGTSGTFQKSGGQVVYAPETFYLGSCPVHLLPAAAGPLLSQLVTREKVPDDIKAAWAKLGDATVDEHTLKLTVQ